MFKDGAATTYDATSARFVTNAFGYTDSVAGTKNPGGAFEMFNFGSTGLIPGKTALESFAAKADNSVVGSMMDCGECHVGGGMMEYVNDTIPTADVTGPVSYDPAKRTSLRDAVFGTAVTAFNYFIDIFGPDGLGYETHNHDGSVRDVNANKPTYAAIQNDFAQSGVLEMDCLMCHKNDYSWDKRKLAVRTAKFDASRAYGAGFAKSIIDGKTVFYNSTSVKPNASGQLTVNLSLLSGQPSSNNCVSCHMGTEENKYQVEWKKRGEMWLPGKEAHIGIGCMGCHERKDVGSIASDKTTSTTLGTSGIVTDAKLGLCDPAKGNASPFEALWNQVDDKQFKKCQDCHATTTNAGTSQTYGAPNPDAIHAAFGLMSSANGGKIAYKADGSRASHLDIIDCTACHIKKSGFSGGAFVDGTGSDLEGRVALHDTENVARKQNNDSIAPHWLNGKIYAGNLLTSFFWREFNGMKTANGGFDANNDGREAGMDPFLPAHISKINQMTGRTALTEYATHDADGNILTGINAAIITAGQGAIKNNIKPLLGVTGTPAILPKLSFLVVPFKASHNIAPATQAWGAKGCKECHAANAGFYNGAYPINGNLDGKFTFDSNQASIFTKVNGSVDTSDAHPNVMDKKNVRSMPVQILSKFDTPNVATVTPGQYLRNIDRSEMLYETDFQTRDTTWYDSTNGPITGAGIVPACATDPIKKFSPFYCADPDGAMAASGGTMTSNPKATATSTIGWILKIETTADNGTTIVSRTKQITNDMVSSVDDGTANSIIAGLGAFTDTNEFTITSNAAKDALVISPKGNYKIRISPQSDVGPLGLKGKLWKADSIVRSTGTYNTRAAYVAYLNSIGAAPTAQISTIGGTTANGDPKTGLPGVSVGTSPIDFVASSQGNPNLTYTWTFSDLPLTDPVTGASNVMTGSTVTRTIASAKSFFANLQVKNVNTGEIKTDKQYVTVSQALPTPSVISGITTTGGVTTVPVTVAATHTRLYVMWGDGTEQSFMDSSTATLNLTHKYYGATSGQVFNGSVKVLNGGTIVGMQSITVTPVP